jgi:hypothetical protein
MPSSLREELTRRTGPPVDAGPALSSPARRRLLIVSGCLLAVVGTVQVGFELMSYFRAAGPFGDIVYWLAYTVGWVEAHGFAVLVGLLFLTVAVSSGSRR